MDNLRAIAVFPKIEPGNVPKFKNLIKDLLVSVSSQKSILRYDVFFTSDDSSCIVLEEYDSAQAVIDHVDTNAEILGKLMDLGGKIEGKMFPQSQSGSAIAHIRENWDSTMHIHFAGK